MKKVRQSLVVTWVALIALLVPVCAPLAGIKLGKTRSGVSKPAEAEREQEEAAAKVSPDLTEAARDPQALARRVRVVLQHEGPTDAALNSFLRTEDVATRRRFQNFGARVLELPLGMVERLSALPGVRFVSLDRETIPSGHVSRTVGADEVRTQAGVVTGPGLDGTGVGIAVIDSGVDTNHTAFLDKSNRVRVVYSRDFTGEGRTDDPYGHGTHVASIAAGNGRISNAAYIGVAPNAQVVNLRVLNSQGTGRVSYILAALDWVLTNRVAYNIKVVNLSLGTSASDSYRDDPLCQAVRRLVDAGVVVVAAAGNNGKDSQGNKVYGQIHSPGVEPSAITVGAANSYGTDARSDDVIASYSSRGPTLSGRVNLLGVRQHDNLIKPDLVAPGNKIVDAAAEDNLLLAQNPSLDAGVSGSDARRMMYLNGTSMATPAVAGAAALLLQANPKLTPNLVKALLMYTAQPVVGANTLEQGAGLLNVEGAARLARLVRTDLSSLTPLGAPLLTGAAPAPQSTIAGQTFNWSQGLILGRGYATGAELITAYQKIYGSGVLVSDSLLVSDGVLVSDSKLLSTGVLVSDQITTISIGGVLGTGSVFIASGVLVSDRVLSDLIGDGVLVSDGVLKGDGILMGLSASKKGDPTAAMPPALDTGSD